ncbi:MAG: hypothetical protein IJ081_06415 [Prevotella sp.]|nr:hypothetical protein [Prevotella sp.]
MRKRLLIAALALVSVVSGYAYEKDSYIYTSTQKFQFTGENIVKNGDFAEGLVGFTGSDAGEFDAATWSLSAGSGPNGENTLKSLGATEGAAFCGVWGAEDGLVDGKSYLASVQIKGADSKTTIGTSIGANYLDFFMNNDGALIRVDGTEEAPVTGIATAQVFYADNWATLCFLFTYAEGAKVVMHIEKMATDVEIANITIQEASQVYDDRVAKRRLAFAKKLLDDPNFSVEAAAEARANMLENVIPGIEGMLEAGELDDIAYAEGMMASFEEEFAAYMDASSFNIATDEYFKYAADLTTFPKYNRGASQMASGSVVGGFLFHGDNWWHGDKAEYLTKQIQGVGNYQVGPGSVSLYNKYMPAGKYYIAAEMRNARCEKGYTLRFTHKAEVSAFVGKDTVKLDSIQGEDFVRFYIVKEFKGGEPFEAGFYWDGPLHDGTFHIKNFEIRSFEDVTSGVAHLKAFESYKAQWDAAVAAREKLYGMVDQKNYIWGQDSLASARKIWDPIWFNQYHKRWITDDGEDAGKATTAELEDWTLYQGVELYTEPDTLGEVKRLEYQLVRNYQWATTYVTNLNKPFSDLATAIDEAKKTRNQGSYASGDRATYKTAIEAAIATIKDVRAKTVDATRVADSTTLADAQAKLAAATEAFIASVELKPIVDIDFETKAQVDGEGNYSIAGAVGQMDFGTNFQPDNSVADWNFAQGYDGVLEDVLHVGGASYGTVALPEPSASDALSITFDLWYGQLGKGFMDVEFLNADGTRVLGFSYDSYNSNVAYNDFDDASGTGMVIKGNVKSNHDKNGGAASVCTDALRNSFTLTIDYSKQTVQGKVVNSSKNIDGAVLPFPALAEDAGKIVSFRIGSSTYQKANNGATGRRCWFDNLKIFKYQLTDFEEDITETGWAEWTPTVDGIATVKENNKFDNTIYTISGVRVNSKNLQKGLYIINGKKVVIK